MKDTKFNFFRLKGTWRDVADACRTTINLDKGTGEPTDLWKRRILMCEHSPIRQLSIKGRWTNLPYFVSTHFVRHKFGLEHWVSSQRTDRRKDGVDRRFEPQNAPVMHEIEANAQALINVSRKRLCCGASVETQKAWRMVKEEISKQEPVLAKAMVRECVYRNGLCPEFYCCGYNKTPAFKKELAEYLEGFEHQLSTSAEEVK